MGNTHLSKDLIFRTDNALNDIRNAFDELSDVWNKLSIEYPLLCSDSSDEILSDDIADEILGPDYPFDTSFDDLTGDVREWVGQCKGRLLHHLIEVVKKEENEQNKISVSED